MARITCSPAGCEPGIAPPIGLERVAIAMERIAVELDGEALVPPVEVELVAVQGDVDLRRRDARAPDEPQEPLLGLGPGERWLAGGVQQLTQLRRAGSGRVTGKQGKQLVSGREVAPLGLRHGLLVAPAPKRMQRDQATFGRAS